MTDATPRDVRDVYGRQYRIGEDARELTGHSRRWQLWASPEKAIVKWPLVTRLLGEGQMGQITGCRMVPLVV